MVGGGCWVEMSGGWWLQDHNLELAIVGMGFYFYFLFLRYDLDLSYEL